MGHLLSKIIKKLLFMQHISEFNTTVVKLVYHSTCSLNKDFNQGRCLYH